MVSAGAGLVGALIGTSSSLAAQRGQRRATREDEVARETRAEERRLADALEQRRREAAEHCDELLARLAQASQVPETDPAGVMRFEGSVALALQAQISSASVLLPDDLRERVDEASRLLMNADAIGTGRHSQYSRFHYRSVWSISKNTFEDVHAAIAAWLQRLPLPDRTAALLEDLAAFTDYTDYLSELYAQQDDGSLSKAREDFFRTHPDLRGPEL
ncbi:MAG: hypothetical protein JWM48_1435 [Mycobacterium sp.]|nr:hypothetical protein [Mycobacterium sp.]